jgi:hypothetical protein
MQSTIDEPTPPVERLLADAGIVPLVRELDVVVDDFRNRHVERSTAREIFEGQQAPPDRSRREFPLAYVVGPVGSGKTYFALRYMKDFGNNGAKGLPSVLLYGQPSMWHDDVDFAAENAPTELVQFVLDLLACRIDDLFHHQWNPTDRNTLTMHAGLVLDDADHPLLQGFFEKKAKVAAFVRALEASRFAQSIMVVVVVVVGGSSLWDGSEVDAASDAHVFRMKAWSSDEFFLQLLNEAAPSKA